MSTLVIEDRPIVEPLAAKGKERVESVDILRGVLAVGVMCYHYGLWSFSEPPMVLRSFLTMMGLYGVETFFIISGFSLYYVYRETDFRRSGEAARFYWKRFMRIAPLFYAALALGILLRIIAVYVVKDPSVQALDAWRVFLNISFLFGLVDPSLSMVVAGWSIGVEMVFYLLFPLMALTLRTAVSRTVVLGLALLLGARFAYAGFTAGRTLAEQWSLYVIPLNHLEFFVGGMVLVFLRGWRQWVKPLVFWTLLLILTAAIVWLCWDKEEVALVSGPRRILLSFFCWNVVFLFCNYSFKPGSMRAVFIYLGNISYSVYLLHFFGFLFAQRMLKGLPGLPLITAAMVLTIIAAHCSYKYLELPLMRIAHTRNWRSLS